MHDLDPYYAVQRVKERARELGKEVTNELIEDEMYKKGYSRGEYLGAGSYKWHKREE